MKTKILMLMIIFVLTISCDGIDSKDKIINSVLEIETLHLKRYNKLISQTKDTITINYLTKLKDTLKNEALTAKGLLNGESGIIFGEFKDSKNTLDNYIKLCENK